MLYLALLSCSLCYVKLYAVHVLLFEQIQRKEEERKEENSEIRPALQSMRHLGHTVVPMSPNTALYPLGGKAAVSQ